MIAKDVSAPTLNLLEAKQSKGGLTTERVAKQEKDGKLLSKAGGAVAKTIPEKAAASKQENPAQDDGQVQSEDSARRRKTARAWWLRMITESSCRKSPCKIDEPSPVRAAALREAQ